MGDEFAHPGGLMLDLGEGHRRDVAQGRSDDREDQRLDPDLVVGQVEQAAAMDRERALTEEAVWLSKDSAKRVENKLQFPGQIKVTVIRETRAIDYAR